MRSERRSTGVKLSVPRQPDLADGVPVTIVEWVKALPAGARRNQYAARLERFREHWRNDESVESAWLTIQAAAKSEEDLLHLFITMPDVPEEQPFKALYGHRVIDPKAEKERYRELGEKAAALADFLSPQRPAFRQFLADLSAPSHAQAEADRAAGGSTRPTASADRAELHQKLAQQVRDECGLPVRRALRVLADALAAVDPFAKVPTKQWAAADRAQTIYTQQVADLARFLKAPKWAALARIANVNCPTCNVTKEALGKIAARKATDKAA